MKNLLRRSAYVLVALASLSAVGFARVGAQTSSTPSSNGFRISPVRSEFVIDKGKSDTLTITLENPSDLSSTAQPIVNDFVASDDESGQPRLILDNTTPLPKDDFKKLVGSLSNVTLGPKEKKDIAVKITVPADASSGGYYGAIRYVPLVGTNSQNVGLTASVGTIILVTVPGNLTEKLDLVQLSAAQKVTVKGTDVYKAKSFFTSGNVAVLTRLNNTGDIHVQPFGKVQIKNMFGHVVYSYEFNNVDPRANILPSSIRRFTDNLPSQKWFGRYTIESNIGYSQGSGNLISGESTFWYIPTLALWGFIALVIVIVGLVYWLIRRNKARKQHKHDVNKKKI